MDGQLTSTLIIILSSMVGAFLGVLLKDACAGLFSRWRYYRRFKDYQKATVHRDEVFERAHYERTYSIEEPSSRAYAPRTLDNSQSELEDFFRRQADHNHSGVSENPPTLSIPEPEDNQGVEFLEIPAFLRRQANEPDSDTTKLIQDALSTLSPGIVLFNPPAVVTVGISERIEVRIAKKPLESLLENLKGRGARKTETIKVSDLMKVTVTGASFLINARSSEEQLISDNEYTEWSWDLVPLKAGPQKLNLKITVAIILPSIKEQRDHPVMEKNILVKSNMRYSVNEFGAKNWQWIAGTLLIPVAVYLWTALSG